MGIKVAVYEDNNALRESLGQLILGEESFELCGIYPDCSAVMENCFALKPDVILMDIDMPGITGIEATAQVKARFPGINIMMLTIYEDKDKVFNALCAGATGYLLKKSSMAQIISAITELHNGGSPMSGEIARKVLDFFSKPKTLKSTGCPLSTRELEILKCLVNGDSYKMIAASCFISIGTVYSHINNIYKKLAVNSKTEAVVKAINDRLV